MNHADHVKLLRDGIHAPGGIWAYFGSGHGAFTLALADLLTPWSTPRNRPRGTFLADILAR